MHSLMASIVRDAGYGGQASRRVGRRLYTLFYPELALEALLDDGPTVRRRDRRRGTGHPAPCLLDVLDAALDGGLAEGEWRVFLDPKQNMFDGTDHAALAELLRHEPVQYRLRVNCRNTAAIATDTAILSATQCDEVLRAEGPDVEHVWYRDKTTNERLVANHVNRLLSEGVSPEQIVVLGRRRLDEQLARGEADVAERSASGVLGADSPAQGRALLHGLQLQGHGVRRRRHHRRRRSPLVGGAPVALRRALPEPGLLTVFMSEAVRRRVRGTRRRLRRTARSDGVDAGSPVLESPSTCERTISSMSARYTMIDLFAGCGGMTRGFHDTGRFGTDLRGRVRPDAAETYRLNFGDLRRREDARSRTCRASPRPTSSSAARRARASRRSTCAASGSSGADSGASTCARSNRPTPWRFVMENVPELLRSAEYARLQADAAEADSAIASRDASSTPPTTAFRRRRRRAIVHRNALGAVPWPEQTHSDPAELPDAGRPAVADFP